MGMGVSIVPPLGQRCVIVDDLVLDLLIGVFEHEKRARQKVSISLAMFVHENLAIARSDDIADHVSYADVIGKLEALARAQPPRHIHLVETLAEAAAAFALEDVRVASVIVEVKKTEIIPSAAGVGVVIHRRRGDLPIGG
jgi:dihydroneopterin aldolase